MTYYVDETVTLHHGDALEVLRSMESGSVDCCVTSPPYFGLRDYGVEGQIGAEASPAEYVERLRGLFAEVRRVLADDGTCWLNLGDSYASDAGGGRGGGSMLQGRKHDQARMPNVTTKGRKSGVSLPRKSLLGIPWRVALALQDDGWILRQDNVWAKRNFMPESVTDRTTRSHEYVFHLTKTARYWYSADAIREDPEPGKGGRNARSVWTISSVPFSGAHFAVFPPELPRRCILAGCKPGGTVLDPFNGSGTTGMVAQSLGRKYIGIDLNAEYLDLTLKTRLADAAFPITEGEAS